MKLMIKGHNAHQRVYKLNRYTSIEKQIKSMIEKYCKHYHVMDVKFTLIGTGGIVTTKEKVILYG